jgi:hypothetical protein
MKFTTPNIIVGHPIPDETRIYFSKNQLVISMILSTLLLGVGLCFLTLGLDYLAGALLCFLLGGAFLYFKYQSFTNNTPQIILNINGLQTAENPFFRWDEITEADITKLEIRNTTYHHLTYKTNQHTEISIRIDNFNISKENLRLLLYFYQQKNTRPGFTYADLSALKS